MRTFKSLREADMSTNVVQTDDVPDDPLAYVEIKPKKSKMKEKEKEDSITETKGAPKGFHFTKDGKLKRGDADVDGPGGPMLRSDPLDKQRSKVPPVSEEAVLDESDLQSQMAAFAASRGGKMTTSAERKQTTADMIAKREKEAASRPKAEPQKTTPYKPLGGRDEKSGRSYSEGVELDETWSKTGKEATHMATGQKTYEYQKLDKEGKPTGERHYRNAAGKVLGEESELGDLAHEKTMKHRFLVTYSDPNHTMVSKRKEKQQKHILVPSTHKGQTVYQGEAEPMAKKYMKKQGYKVHEIEHVGMVTKKVNEETEQIDELKTGTLLRYHTKAGKSGLQAGIKGSNAMDAGNTGDAMTHFKKSEKRMKGQAQAMGKIQKRYASEGVDLSKVWESIRTPSIEDEIVMEDLDAATLKAKSDRIMAEEIKAHKALMQSE